MVFALLSATFALEATDFPLAASVFGLEAATFPLAELVFPLAASVFALEAATFRFAGLANGKVVGENGGKSNSYTSSPRKHTLAAKRNCCFSGL